MGIKFTYIYAKMVGLLRSNLMDFQVLRQYGVYRIVVHMLLIVAVADVGFQEFLGTGIVGISRMFVK